MELGVCSTTLVILIIYILGYKVITLNLYNIKINYIMIKLMEVNLLKKFFYVLLLASMIAVFTGTSFADNYVGGKPLETIQNDTVTGDLLVDSYYGFNATDEKNVTYTFNYTVPQGPASKMQHCMCLYIWGACRQQGKHTSM